MDRLLVAEMYFVPLVVCGFFSLFFFGKLVTSSIIFSRSSTYLLTLSKVGRVDMDVDVGQFVTNSFISPSLSASPLKFLLV